MPARCSKGYEFSYDFETLRQGLTRTNGSSTRPAILAAPPVRSCPSKYERSFCADCADCFGQADTEADAETLCCS